MNKNLFSIIICLSFSTFIFASPIQLEDHINKLLNEFSQNPKFNDNNFLEEEESELWDFIQSFNKNKVQSKTDNNSATSSAYTAKKLKNDSGKNKSKEYLCGKCTGDKAKKNWKCKYKLDRHMVVHASDNPFKCTIDGCEKSFSQKSSAKVHIIKYSAHRNLSKDEKQEALALLSKQNS